MIAICPDCVGAYDTKWAWPVCPHEAMKVAKAPFHPKRNPGGYCMEHGQQACKAKHLADTLEIGILGA